MAVGRGACGWDWACPDSGLPPCSAAGLTWPGYVGVSRRSRSPATKLLLDGDRAAIRNAAFAAALDLLLAELTDG